MCEHRAKNFPYTVSVLIRLLEQNYHRQGSLNNKHLILIVLEAGKSKVSALVVSGEESCPGSHIGVLVTMSSHDPEGQEASSLVPYRVGIPFMMALSL